MRWPKDLGEWGFILSLLALLLMYPVGLIVNISSPKTSGLVRWVVKKTASLRELTNYNNASMD